MERLSLRVGTSGWYYDEWVGRFYRQKKGMLTAYAKVFDTTGVNSTFYRYPSPRMVQSWYRSAPPGFVYALKLHKVITHDKWLRLRQGVEDDTQKFLDLIQPLRGLGHHRGPSFLSTLVQFFQFINQ